MMLPALTPAAYEMHFLAGLAIAWLAGRRWLIWLIVLAVAKEGFDLWWHGKPDLLDIIFTLFGGFTYKLIAAWKTSISPS